MLDTPIEIDNRPNAASPNSINGRVEFRDVSFSYDGTKPVLRHVSLDVPAGHMIGLCGHSGAGKSTFVNLISRFFDVSDGRILIDGRDVRDYDLTWLRSHVGVVLQDPYLFYGTIGDNIRYGKPHADFGEVVAAARAANAHDFITKLPTATTPPSANAAKASAAASGSASASPARSCTTRKYSCSTRRPAASTPRPSGRSRRRWTV